MRGLLVDAGVTTVGAGCQTDCELADSLWRLAERGLMRFGRDEAGTMYYQVRADHAARMVALLDGHACIEPPSARRTDGGFTLPPVAPYYLLPTPGAGLLVFVHEEETQVVGAEVPSTACGLPVLCNLALDARGSPTAAQPAEPLTRPAPLAGLRVTDEPMQDHIHRVEFQVPRAGPRDVHRLAALDCLTGDQRDAKGDAQIVGVSQPELELAWAATTSLSKNCSTTPIPTSAVSATSSSPTRPPGETS